MKEILRTKRFATVLAVIAGGLAIAGCNGETHGLAGMELVDCQNGPKTNEVTLQDFAKGQTFGLGKDIQTGDGGSNGFQNDYSIHAPFTIESLGKGAFTYFEGTSDQPASVPPTPHPDGSFTLTLVNEGQQYTLTGTPNADGSTHLAIDASCTPAQP